MGRLLGAFALLFAGAALSAPYTPSTDDEVVEKLPLASDPALRTVESLRRQLASRPTDPALRLDIAERYFALAMAQGDPRYVGYATAVIAPLETASANDARFWLVRGQLQQYAHDFEGALASLERASRIAPEAPEPWVHGRRAHHRDRHGRRSAQPGRAPLIFTTSSPTAPIPEVAAALIVIPGRSAVALKRSRRPAG